MTTTYSPAFATSPNSGLRLTDSLSIFNAIANQNGITRAYGITTSGTTQATATPLTSVINQLATVSSGAGVNLPLTTGTSQTPFCFCIIVNQGGNDVKVFAAQGSSETINGTAGATGGTQTSGTNKIYVSAKPGAWFSI